MNRETRHPSDDPRDHSLAVVSTKMGMERVYISLSRTSLLAVWHPTDNRRDVTGASKCLDLNFPPSASSTSWGGFYQREGWTMFTTIST